MYSYTSLQFEDCRDTNARKRCDPTFCFQTKYISIAEIVVDFDPKTTGTH